MTTQQAQASTRELPRLRGGLPWLGHALAFQRDPVAFLRHGRETAGDAFMFTLLGQRVAFMSGPSAHQAVFAAKEELLSCREAYRFMVPIVGEGVLYGAERSVMEEQMKMAQGPLTGKQLRENAAVMAAEAQAYLDALGERGELDLWVMMGELTASIASRCLVGPEFRARLAGELRDLYHDMEDGIQLAGLVNPRLPLPPFRRRDRARARVAEVIHDIIGERRRSGAQPEPRDMLSTLMSARYADGSAPTDDVIAGLLVSVVFAGHHTSAAHGTWTGVLLLAHPQWYQRARAEQDWFAEQDPELTQSNLHRMTVLDQCLKETERMFPPLPVLMRVAMSDFVHDGYTVPKGALVFVSPGASHRRPDVFRDPDDYCPARFGPGREEDRRTPYGLIGFGGGVHGCIGLAFAQQQLKIIWSLLLRRFDLEAMQPLGPADHSTFVARPSIPCVIRYRRRESMP
jgi:sterol 14-demethylase